MRKRQKNAWLVGAAGFAGGIVLSRLIPQVLAQARGAAGSAMGEDPFARLIAEHRLLLSLLTRMEQIPASQPMKRMLLMLKFKRTIAKHAMAEEDVVYPLLHDEADRADAAKKLYAEHADMKIHLFNLQQTLKDEEKWKMHVRALHEEIAGHARQEEEEEFPRVRALGKAREGATLARNLRQEEALIL